MPQRAEFVSSLKKLYERTKTKPDDLFVEALAVGFEDDYKQSIEIIDKAIYLSSGLDKSLFWVFKAMGLNRLKRDDEALECVEKALQIHKEDPLGWNIKGDLLHDLGKYEEALEAYENSIKYSDEYELPESLLDKVEVLNHLERNEEALKIVNESLALDSKNPNAWDLKSDILNDLEKHEEALEAAEKGLSFDPEHGDLLNDKGSVLIDLKKYEESLSYLNKAIQLNPSDDLAWYNKACALSLLNKKEEALDALTVAIGLDIESIIEMKADKDLENIKNTDRFNRLASQEI